MRLAKDGRAVKFAAGGFKGRDPEEKEEFPVGVGETGGIGGS